MTKKGGPHWDLVNRGHYILSDGEGRFLGEVVKLRGSISFRLWKRDPTFCPSPMTIEQAKRAVEVTIRKDAKIPRSQICTHRTEAEGGEVQKAKAVKRQYKVVHVDYPRATATRRILREYRVVGGKGRVWAKTKHLPLAEQWCRDLNDRGYIEE